MAASTSINSYFRSRINQFHSNTCSACGVQTRSAHSYLHASTMELTVRTPPLFSTLTNCLPKLSRKRGDPHFGNNGMETVKVADYPSGTQPSTDPTSSAPGNPTVTNLRQKLSLEPTLGQAWTDLLAHYKRVKPSEPSRFVRRVSRPTRFV